mmetsp:Transcript_60402/g.143991  ORF Transcript_60402/g.143991 Transcript_60402/m.143991 type:complete len:529 (+) Transcript_60402:99-1685(+)
MEAPMLKIHVVMAASGADVGVVELNTSSTVSDLRREVATLQGVLLSQVSMLAAHVDLQDMSARLASALPPEAEASTGASEDASMRRVQLVLLPPVELESVKAKRRKLSDTWEPHEHHGPAQEAVEDGTVPLFVGYLYEDSWPELQAEAAWALTNVAASTSEHTACLAQHGGIEAFVRLISSPNQDVIENAFWALGNIAGDCREYRDRVLEAGGLENAMRLLMKEKPRMLESVVLARCVCWTLGNFALHTPPPSKAMLQPLIDHLGKLLSLHDAEALSNMCIACERMAEMGADVQDALASESSGYLVNLLSHGHTGLKTAAAKAVACLAACRPEKLLAEGLLRRLPIVLQDGSAGPRREACKIAGILLSGSRAVLSKVLEQGSILPALRDLEQAEASQALLEPLAIKEEALLLPERRACLVLLLLAGSMRDVRNHLLPATAEKEVPDSSVKTALSALGAVLSIQDQDFAGDADSMDLLRAKGFSSIRDLISAEVGLEWCEAALHKHREHNSKEIADEAAKLWQQVGSSS